MSLLRDQTSPRIAGQDSHETWHIIGGMAALVGLALFLHNATRPAPCVVCPAGATP